MKHLMNVINLKKVYRLGSTVAAITLLVGCGEIDTAIDTALGLQSPALSPSVQTSPQALLPASSRAPGEMQQSSFQIAQAAKPPAARPKPGAAGARKAAAPAGVPEMEGVHGKKRAPGELSPALRGEEGRGKEVFIMARDPFEQPTEILPTECPPSMPLCRFDRSQLKLVGVIQVSDGNYKGMIQDPDGRGYFITTGMQIGGGTVTQVTTKGITLHMHKTRQDVLLPLFSELGGEF